MKRQKQQPDTDYIRVLVAAAGTHQTVRPLADRLGAVLQNLEVRGVPQPTDWDFSYTGYVELRWHDGIDRFASSTKWVGLIISSDGLQIRGRIDGKKSYESDKGINIGGLPDQHALEIVKYLVQSVFAAGDAK